MRNLRRRRIADFAHYTMIISEAELLTEATDGTNQFCVRREIINLIMLICIA